MEAIYSTDWNRLLKGFDEFVRSYMFHNDGLEPDVILDFKDIADDIALAERNGEDFILVDTEVLKAFVEIGVVFK